MPTNKLSVLEIKNAKSVAEPYKMADGLHVLVIPSGSKLWRLQYRFGGKQRQIALGQFPQLGVADARLEKLKAISRPSAPWSLPEPEAPNAASPTPPSMPPCVASAILRTK